MSQIKPKQALACGVIGLGWWGGQMLDNLLKTKRFKVISVYDSSWDVAASVAKRVGCGVASSFEEVIDNPEIKCVFIFSPNDSHPQYAIAAANVGKHIFLEKPIANTVVEAETITRACENNGVILAVGHNVRHYGIFQKARELIMSDTLGDIVYIEGNRSRPIGRDITEKSWRFYKKSCNGGPVIQMVIHLVDAVRYITGINLSVIQSISAKRFLKTENDESYSISAKDESGVLLHLFTSYISPESFYLNFHGTKAALFVDPFNGLFLQESGSLLRRRISYKKTVAEIDEILEFYKSIIDQLPYESPSPSDAVDNVRIVEAILEAA